VPQSSPLVIRNPVLPGFHPDPSILRVGVDYYLATSTFEWFPGVPVYHSRDLTHWQPLGHALTDPAVLDLRGVPDSAGVWAPSLSHHDGQYWLVYTIVRATGTAFKDVENYVVTGPSPIGPWSPPVFLNASGFDPSMFHDEDGRHWLVNVRWDFRPDRPSFAGIVLQEYDADKQSLIGEPKVIARTDELIEGPNLYRRGDWYYLMLAEGGTGWNHGIRLARSRAVDGPYELDDRPLLTTRAHPGHPLQKAGHGELVETPDGEWFLAHLASRPVLAKGERRSVLGRETCLQRVEWTADGWLRLSGGGFLPEVEVPGPAGGAAAAPALPEGRDDFDDDALGFAWSSLRAPLGVPWLSLTERPGWLRLRGRHSVHSLFDQTLVAQRLASVHCVVRTRMSFSPESFAQTAGLICWYNTSQHYYLRATYAESRGIVLGVTASDDGRYLELGDDLGIGDWPDLHLRATFDGPALRFSASPDGRSWQEVGPVLDGWKLSDDYGSGMRFTGAFVGLAVQDLEGTRVAADFDFFEILPRS